MERVPVAPGLFELDTAGRARLIGGACGACSRVHFPAASDCPYCGADGCQRRMLSERGTLWLCTTVSSRPPGYVGDVPFGFGVVELPEGLRVITRVEGEGEVAPGTAMVLTLVPLHVDEQGREVVTYAFAPAGEGG